MEVDREAAVAPEQIRSYLSQALRAAQQPPQRRWKLTHGRHQLSRLTLAERRRRGAQRYLREQRRAW